MNESKNIFKRVGFIAIGLCIACCAFPIVGVLIGIGTLSIIAKYIEWAGTAALVLAIIFFGIYYYKKKKAPACDLDCESKPKTLENSSGN